MPLSSENITRRTFLGSLVLGAAVLGSSAIGREPDPRCFIRGSKKSKNPIDLSTIVACTVRDPLVRITASSVIVFAAGVTWLRSRN